jgi:LPXTG-motif cell wall-anchored protein
MMILSKASESKLRSIFNGGQSMYQPQVLGDKISLLPNTGDSHVALITGGITLLVGAVIVVTTVLRMVAKKKAQKA